MITVKINNKARGSKQLIKHLHTLQYVEFEENKHYFDDIDAEFEALEEQCITGDELVRRAYVHIDELFDAKTL
jgi:hypothetical protein